MRLVMFDCFREFLYLTELLIEAAVDNFICCIVNGNK